MDKKVKAKQKEEPKEEPKEVKKQKNIFVYFICMFFLFLVILFAQQFLSGLLSDLMSYGKNGDEAIFEIIWAGLVLIVLLLFKNKYVFTQDREPFSKGIKYILPELVLSGIFLVSSITALIQEKSASPAAIINLIILCFFIGIVEEFLCRGWLLNEFLERYGSTKKGILLSILFSSLVFGLIHFMNVGEAQSFVETVIQVLNATVSGVFLALVYYKTKNIWLVVFSHAVWDFSLMLSDINVSVDCYVNGTATPSIIIYSAITSLLVVVAYSILVVWMYRKTDLYAKEDNKKVSVLLFTVGVILYAGTMFLIPEPKDNETYNVCPEYDTKKISTEYTWTYSFISDYNLNFSNEQEVYYNNDESGVEEVEIAPYTNNNNYSFTLTSNGLTGEVIFKNNLTNKKVSLADDYYDYILIENEEDYIILIQTDSNIVKYGKYKKSSTRNVDAYLEYVKNNLKEYHVPESSTLGMLKIMNDNYTYASVNSKINEGLIFDKDDNLYFIDVE